jgi:gamma-glutamyltranspeptidase
MIETPVFSKAAVAAPHARAAETGRAILAEGGNAVEAMIGMAATIAVVYPHMNSIGGDGFWIIRDASGAQRYIEACGFAGSRATIARYRDLGHDTIPARGPLAAVTVPGTIGGWALAAETAAALGGRMPLRELLGEAVALARDGYPQSPSEAAGRPLLYDALKEAPGFAATYLDNGELPPAGTTRTNKALAATLEQLGHAGLDDFYRGDVGRELAEDMDAIGAGSTRDDLKRYRAMYRPPLTLRLPGRTHVNAPPPTQGIAALAILGMFERLGVTERDGFAHIHGLIEATKRGLALRDRFCTDYDHLAQDPADLLEAKVLDREAGLIRTDRAATLPIDPAPGDTIWMGAIDAKGCAVSFIQSIYWEYGSGCVLPRTGVLLQNRGSAFSLDPNALNPLQPGRRPIHTLNPALVAYDDGRVMVYGSMGGDGQPQFQAQIFTRMHMGQGLAAAIDAPRFLFGRTWGDLTSALQMEDRFDDTVLRRLRAAGHEAIVVPHAYSSGFGHAGAVRRDAKGRVEAAHDPRSDGGAAGL